MSAFDRFVGLPWAEKGRGLDGADCWGIVCLVLGSVGLAVPSHAEGYAGLADRDAISGLVDEERPLWQPVEAGRERAYDVVLFHEHPWHIGVVVGRGMMLHVVRRGSSVIETYRSGRWSRPGVIEGFYRYITARSDL